MVVCKGSNSSLLNHAGEPVELWASFGHYPGSKMHVTRSSCFPSNKYRVFLEYMCHSITHSLTLRPHWDRVLVEAVIHLDFPFSIFLCGSLPSQTTTQNDCNKKQQSTSNLTERLAGGQTHFPLLLCIPKMTDYVAPAQFHELHIKEQEVMGEVIRLTLMGSA